MMIRLFRFWVPGIACLLLAACGSSNFQDLDEFMADRKARPVGTIKPIPPFKTYKSFTYSATALRNPFEPPVDVKDIAELSLRTSVAPDENRRKEFLEQFGIDSLKMVGTLEQGGTMWALIQTREGGVFRVTMGNYMGRNDGRIVDLGEDHISVIEIVPNGVDGWIERPRTIKLSSKE